VGREALMCCLQPGARGSAGYREACASVLVVAVVAHPVSTPCNRLLDDWPPVMVGSVRMRLSCYF